MARKKFPLGKMEEDIAIGHTLPEQFSEPTPIGRTRAHGEAALMRAVLEDALNCFYKQFTRPSRRNKRLAKEAEEWFASKEETYLYSFKCICSVLGLDPSYIRKGVKEITAGKTYSEAVATQLQLGQLRRTDRGKAQAYQKN